MVEKDDESSDPDKTPVDSPDAKRRSGGYRMGDVPCPACSMRCVCGQLVLGHRPDEMHKEAVLRPDCALCKGAHKVALSDALKWNSDHKNEAP